MLCSNKTTCTTTKKNFLRTGCFLRAIHTKPRDHIASCVLRGVACSLCVAVHPSRDQQHASRERKIICLSDCEKTFFVDHTSISSLTRWGEYFIIHTQTTAAEMNDVMSVIPLQTQKDYISCEKKAPFLTCTSLLIVQLRWTLYCEKPMLIGTNWSRTRQHFLTVRERGAE